MLRLLLALLIVATSTAPMAALAQGGENVVNAVSNTTTNISSTTTNTTETTNAVEPANSAGGSTPEGRQIPRTAIDASGDALLKLFVLAVILESAARFVVQLASPSWPATTVAA